MEKLPLGPKAQEAVGPRERIRSGLCIMERIGPQKENSKIIPSITEKWVTQKISSHGDEKVPLYPRYGAWVVHMWLLEDSWNHEKVQEHGKRLKNFTSALMMRFLPHLCHIKCKWDNLNSSSNPQKSEFQNKGEEESDKVEKNILEALVGNRTAMVIRAMTEAIERRGEAKY